LLPPQDRATFFAVSISHALNGTAFYALVLVPAALVAVAIVRRLRRRR
jgi:predicted MFS family arabinose efflux permease